MCEYNGLIGNFRDRQEGSTGHELCLAEHKVTLTLTDSLREGKREISSKPEEMLTENTPQISSRML